MRYYLQPALLAPPKPLRISREDFARLAEAHKTLVAAFPLEENFDLLLGNYLELEKSVLSIAATYMVRTFSGYQEASDIRLSLNRHVINLLTAARLYVDQLPQRVRACGADPAAARQALRERYDADFEYRFMEALRNHVQHCGSAVHSYASGGGWEGLGGRERQRHALEVYALRRELEIDDAFKKAVLKECPDKVELLHASRVYVESLGAVHLTVRSMVEGQITDARNTVESAIARYERHSKSTSLALTATAAIGSAVKERVPVILEWEKVRIALERRNGSTVNLRKRFTSSLVAADDD